MWSVWYAQAAPYKTVYIYRCDGPDCKVFGFEDKSRKSRSHSRLVNVRPCGQGVHYCPEHYPMNRCRVCRRHIRPDQAPANLWPETVSKGWDGKCHSCSLGMFEEIHVKPLPAEDVRVIRRMIEDRFDDPDERFLLLDSLVGGDID